MRGRLDARRTLKSLVADLRINSVLCQKVTVRSKIGDGQSVAARGDTQPCELYESLGGGALVGVDSPAKDRPR